jgi:hypothetical protein
MTGQRFSNFAAAVPGAYFNIWNEGSGAGPVVLIAPVTIESPQRLVLYNLTLGTDGGAGVSVIALQLSSDGGSSFNTILRWSINPTQDGAQASEVYEYPLQSPMLDVFGTKNDAGAEQQQIQVVLTQTGGTPTISAGFTGRLIGRAAA